MKFWSKELEDDQSKIGETKSIIQKCLEGGQSSPSTVEPVKKSKV